MYMYVYNVCTEVYVIYIQCNHSYQSSDIRQSTDKCSAIAYTTFQRAMMKLINSIQWNVEYPNVS